MQILTALRIFAFFLFLFLPSIVVLMFCGFVLRDTHYFVGFGLLALTGNGVFLLLTPVRGYLRGKLDAMAR